MSMRPLLRVAACVAIPTAVLPVLPATASPAVPPALRDAPAVARASGRTWVYFADKGVAPGAEPAALAALERTADPRMLERRRLRRTAPGLLDVRDLPVAEAHLDALRAAGARVHVTSRWLNAASVEAAPDALARIAALPFVRRLEPVRGGRRAEPVAPEGAGAPAAAGSDPFYGLSFDQLTQIDLVALHGAGATGAGVIVGILDTGFRRDHAAFNHPDHPLQVIAEHDFINDDGNAGPEAGDPSNQHAHGTLILGTLGAYAPGELVGGAYDAAFVLCKTEDVSSETPIEEDNYVAGLEFIELHGGDVATSSLGYIDWYTQGDLDGQTAVTTIAVNVATENGVHCCTAAGNAGHDEDPGTSHLIAPSDAFRVITCGAAHDTGEIAGFSSDGPTADGRVKPEVLARGVATSTVSYADDFGYLTASGTSLSTPLVAAAVACMTQARPTWTVDQLRAMLFATASDMVQNGTFDPDFVRGYGMVDAWAAVTSDCNANGVPDADDVEGGGSADANGNGVPDECECPADLDGTGDVGFADLLAVLAAWGPCGACAEDLDASGTVDFADVLLVLSAWGDCG